MILKAMLCSLLILTINSKKVIMLLMVLLLVFHDGNECSIPCVNTFFLFFALVLWEINLFTSISCQGKKNIMLPLHRDMILEQYALEFC